LLIDPIVKKGCKILLETGIQGGASTLQFP